MLIVVVNRRLSRVCASGRMAVGSGYTYGALSVLVSVSVPIVGASFVLIDGGAGIISILSATVAGVVAYRGTGVFGRKASECIRLEVRIVFVRVWAAQSRSEDLTVTLLRRPNPLHERMRFGRVPAFRLCGFDPSCQRWWTKELKSEIGSAMFTLAGDSDQAARFARQIREMV